MNKTLTTILTLIAFGLLSACSTPVSIGEEFDEDAGAITKLSDYNANLQGFEKIIASASQSGAGTNASNVIDGKLSSRWSASGLNPWVQLDLGQVTNLSDLQIAWHRGKRRIKSFDVQVSSDAVSWPVVTKGAKSSEQSVLPESQPINQSALFTLLVASFPTR